MEILGCKKQSSVTVWVVVLGIAWLTAFGPAAALASAPEDDAYLAAMQHFNQREWDAARQGFTDFLRVYPQSHWRLGARLRLADLESDPARSEKLYVSVLADAANTEWAGDARWALANTCFALGKYAEAFGNFQLLVQAGDPRRVRALYLAGRCQAAIGKSASAKTLFTQVRDDFPSSAEAELALAALGDLETAAAHPDAARTLYDQYLQQYPDGQLTDEVRAKRDALLGKQVAATPAAVEASTTSPTAAAAPAIPATAGAPGDSFTVQVGAFSKPEYAAKLVKRLHAKGYTAYRIKTQTGADFYYQVRVGNYARRALAEVIAAKLEKKERLPTLILLYSKPENP